MQRYQHGGGLIEGLVSLVILSVGLLGMAGMQGTLIQESSESRTRMQAGRTPRDLRPCPFCANERLSVVRAGTGKDAGVRVCCTECGASGPMASDQDPVGHAEHMWNQRFDKPH